jgi:large subunit ribosomal protein L21
MSYAVISDRGSQYTVKAGERLRIASRAGEVGSKLVFDKVLAVGGGTGAAKVGVPEVAGARVEATVVKHGRGKKVIIFKIRRRKGYRRKQGHRQDFTEVRIDSVVGA